MKLHEREPPRVELANLPTPLHELRRLAGELRIPRLLIKRDDLTGLEVSGNKVRKLEYLVADALRQGADTLVTLGGWQSNHGRATAAVAARMGLGCRLILRAPESGEPRQVGNLLLDRLFGAEISIHPPVEYNGQRERLIADAIDDLRRAGRRPYFFGVGGSSPVGCWGYVRAMGELSRQWPGDPSFDLFLPISSAGTLTGVLAGRRLLGLDRLRVLGVMVSDDADYFRREVPSHLRQFAETFDLPVSLADEPFELIDGHIGAGYAIPTESSLQALRRVARLEGVLTDPVYTAKAIDGMIATLRGGGVRPGATPIFLHTGGVFGLMAMADLFSAER